MRPIVIALFLQLCLLATAATAADPSDCEDEARKLRREASEVEDAASSWQGVRDDADRAGQARRQAQSAAESAYQRAGRMMRACVTGVPPKLGAEAAIANIRAFLLFRFGESQATRSRISVVDAELQGLALLHAQVSPADYRLTYAIAEAVFSGQRGK